MEQLNTDLLKCNNEDCKDRHICYRYLATNQPNQQFKSFKFNEETGLCEYYLPVFDPY